LKNVFLNSIIVLKKRHKLLTEDDIKPIELIEDMLYVSHSVMEKLFDVVIAPIINHAKLLNEKLPQIKYIFLVGGFAESPMIQSAFKKNFPAVKIIHPLQPIKSILEGGVIYGLYPEKIKIRKAINTYGILVSMKFIEGKHLDSDKHKIDGIDYGKELDVFIKKEMMFHLMITLLKITAL